MTKNDFLSQLSFKLRVLPESELQDALEYYEGYISDAEDEQAAITSLGSPGEVAATILANYVSQKPRPHHPSPSRTKAKTGRTKIKTAYIAIIAIFAVPIGIPLAFAALGLITGLVAVIFSVLVAGIALIVGGLVALVTSPMAFISDFWFGMLSGGLGIAALGIGILAFKCGVKLFSGFPAIARIIRRRGGRDEAPRPGAFHPSQQPPGEEYAHSSFERSKDVTDGTWGHAPISNSNSMPLSAQESHTTVTTRRSLPGIRFAILLILVGAAMFGMAWHNGARGGVVFWDGRVRVQTAHREDDRHVHEFAQGERSDNFHQVHITATNRNIVILPSTTGRAVYTGTSNVNIGIEDGILTISQRASGTGMFNLMDIDFSPGSTREVRLYLPPEFFQYPGAQITVRTTTGSIQVEGDFPSLYATATSGNIEIANNINSVSTLNLRTTTGRINVDNIHQVDTLYATATTGNINIRNIRNGIGTANIRTTTGRITARDFDSADTLYFIATTGNIYLRDVENNVHSVTMRTTTGRQTIENVPHIEIVNTTSTTGRVDITNIGWATMGIRTTTGRIDISRGRPLCPNGNMSSTSLVATTGNANVELLANQEDFRLSLVSTTGRIQSGGARLADRGMIDTGSGDNIIDIRTTSGSITVDFSG